MGMAPVQTLPRTATRPTWAEVSLGNLRENFRTVAGHVRGATICAVVKADAYGHGAVECARALAAEGATWFGVTSTDEAIPLREAGIAGRILIMTGIWRGEENEVIRRQLTPTVWEPWHVDVLEKAAAAAGVRHPVHLKVDTGMGRLGASLEDLSSLCARLSAAKHLHVEGLSTHLALSEMLDANGNEEQLRRFQAAENIVRGAGLSPVICHVANTGAVVARPEAWRNMVRPGIALYGYHLPFQHAGSVEEVPRLALKPALSWKTRVLSLREVGAGQALGYGGTYVTKSRTRLAVLPVGYADGLNRRLSNCGRVIVRRSYGAILGRISMDLTLVDVTEIPNVTVGDEVVLLGASGELNVDAHEHARHAETVAYEILCAISKRVPRKYLESSAS